MKAKEVLKLIQIFREYPVEVILVKHLILDGIDTEEKLLEFLKTDETIRQPMKVKLQNHFQDIVKTGLYDIKKIPLIFK
jgi:hypothetical protein